VRRGLPRSTETFRCKIRCAAIPLGLVSYVVGRMSIMTREEKKKRAAAVAAVIRYLEEDRRDQGRKNLWARAGRMEAMQAGRMVQMRVVSARRFPGL